MLLSHGEQGFRTSKPRAGKGAGDSKKSLSGDKASGRENFDFLGLTTNSIEGCLLSMAYAAQGVVNSIDMPRVKSRGLVMCRTVIGSVRR